MILNLAFIFKDFYISDQIKFRPILLLLCLDITNLHIRRFCYLHYSQTFTDSIFGPVILIKLTSI